jgi:flagellar motor protein MotB
MKTAEVKTTGVTGKADNNATTNKTDNHIGNGQKINNLPVSTAFNDKKDEPKKEEPKKEEPKAEATAKPEPQAEQPKAEEAKPQAEQTKKELKEQFAEQQARKLEDTVKLVEALGKKIAQKNKLQNTIANLDSFTLAQNDDKDDMASDSRFHRCELVIADDDGNEFVTKNPFIIAYVAHEVKELCIDKLKEVEESIIIPL